MALFGKCKKCGTYFMDMFGEFYDEETQELECPLCGSRDIEGLEGDEDVDWINLFNFDKYIEVDDKTGNRKRIQG